MNRKPYSQILDSIARDHMAENTDLAARILVRIQKGKGATMQPRVKMFVTAVLVLLVLMIALASVPAVRAAIQRWFGYVPDVGLVSAGQIRVLAEPVSVTRDGITLTVEQVVVDSEHTTVNYKVEGLAGDIIDYTQLPQNPLLNPPDCGQDAFLRLPKADLSLTGQDGSSSGGGYEHRSIYPAIAAEINEVTFVMPCVRFTLVGKAPENWELSLHLIPAPPEMTVFPVIEISTPVEVTSTAAPLQSGGEVSAEAISMVLDRAVQMDDGYLLYATLHWENTKFYSVDVYDNMTVHLLGPDGQEIPFVFDYDALSDVEWQQGQKTLAIKTAPIQVAGPLTLVLDSVVVDTPVDGRFTFDPGPDPVPGQEWPLDQLVDVGNGHSLRVLRATYPAPPMEGWPMKPGLTFEMESDTGISNALVSDADPGHQMNGAGGGGGGSGPGPFNAGFNYAEDFPEGPLTIQVNSIQISLPGHWEAQWTPPFSEQQAAATPQPDACLNRESWPQALNKREPIPTGLAGTLAIFDVLPPDYNYEVMVVGLDGSNRRDVGPGGSPSLSPDGARVVYTESPLAAPANGLYITDLVAGSTALLPGTIRGDDGALWSPDGTQIAFTRGPSSGLIGAPGPYNIFVVNADGSNLRQLTSGSDTNHALAWMPDGNQILYSAANQQGSFLQAIDVQTGEVTVLSNSVPGGALSPDGKRMAFTEMLPLDMYGLWVADVDGSNRKLLANGDPYIVTIPMWSPDGKWVIASVQDPDPNKEPSTTLALIQVDTCQIVPLPNMYGYVTSWLP
jgi:Tol biopolymer transport system component